ncbi:lytic transglycosylase domain-containing protein [Luteimonas vadosa]|uniref:Transglycosylase SLT domain-containing protein n=1 Tax=Luteimonas vadosa TaxID=1165507 RepID=A0ABP9DXQ8_9GAMM
MPTSARPRCLYARFLASALILVALAVPAQDASDPQARTALEAAERGLPIALPERHPLRGWAEYALLARDLDAVTTAQGQDFLQRYNDQPVAEVFRAAWLTALAKREEWSTFRAAWVPGIEGTRLRCHSLQARAQAGAVDAQWIAEAQAIWRSTGESLPDACDAPFATLAARGALSPELRWERLEKAAAAWQPGIMRAIARDLPAPEAALANDYAAFIDAPHTRALNWPKTPRSRLVASHGLAKLAKSDPDAGEAQLQAFADALGFSEADRGRVLYQSALWTVASYLPGSARRLNAVPDAAYDERLHEWRVREALSRSDWRAARQAIAKMGAEQRGDSRWTYFAARTAELTGDKAGAQALYRDAARAPDFHGFLAADRIGQHYALCPWLPDDPASAKAAVARDPGMVRAMMLYRIDRAVWAQREWAAALDRFDDTQRRLAVEIAQDNGWFDRGVFGLVNVGGKHRADELRLYKLRFPLHHDGLIRREAAKNGVDPAWVAAEIRAESVFNPNARSPADARGLMQVLPETGAAVARRNGLPWNGAQSLYDPAINIPLGTAYLREMKEKYGRPYIAIAAYNAGPTPTARWQSQRPAMDPDFWIETISYKETREYVARVLAFSVIYDWRLNGDAVPVTDRMNGRIDVPRKRFSCPLAQPPKG